MVAPGDLGGRRRRDPFGLDARVAQHHLHAPAALVGHDQHGRALAPRPARAARTVLQRFRVARQLHVDHQAHGRQVDAARRHVRRHAHARTPVAQRLDRVVALGLRVLARQRHGVEAALGQARVQPPHGLARRAEQDGGGRFMEAQQVHHRMLDVGRRHRDGLVGDVGVAFAVAGGLDAQRAALVALGQRQDGPRHGGGKQQRAPAFRRRVEQLLQLLAEAHVQHLVGLVQHDRLQRRQVQRAALQMVAQPPRRPHHNRRPGVQRPALAHRVHAAHARHHPRPRAGIKPFQLLRHLDRQFARGGHHQHQRRARHGRRLALQQLVRHRQPERHGLSGTRLRRHDQVAPARVLGQHGGLHRGQGFISARGQGLGERGVGHGVEHRAQVGAAALRR